MMRNNLIRSLLLGVGIPILVTAGSIAYVVAHLGRLPDDIALHWGLNGPDRFGSATNLIMENAIMGAFMLLVSLLIVAMTYRTQPGRRFGIGTAAATGSFMGPMLVQQVPTSSIFPVVVTPPPPTSPS